MRLSSSWTLTRLVNLSQPCCVILAMVLHFFAPEQAARIARTFITALTPGSCLILSVGNGDDPGLTDARYWRGQPGQDTAGERSVIILAGVGAKAA